MLVAVAGSIEGHVSNARLVFSFYEIKILLKNLCDVAGFTAVRFSVYN